MKIPTDELLVHDKVLLKEKWWTVVNVDGARVTVSDGIRNATTDKVNEWEVQSRRHQTILDAQPAVTVGSEAHAPEPSSSTEGLITTQEYLRAVGMPDDKLEGNARTFGTVLMKLYRARHGRDARPAKKLEYVHYLDVNGMEAQSPNDQAPRHLRVRANGWYESNAFEASDLDLFEEVRTARHPSLPSLGEATDRAMAVLMEEFDMTPRMVAAEGAGHISGPIWLAEKTVQECLASGVVCGHTECARRRSQQVRNVRKIDEEMDWS